MIDTMTAEMRKSAPALRAVCDVAPGLPVLANTEKKVLVEITEGFRNKEIASRLGLSVRAVESHRERLMRKLRIRGVARLTQFAVLQGLVALDCGIETNDLPILQGTGNNLGTRSGCSLNSADAIQSTIT